MSRQGRQHTEALLEAFHEEKDLGTVLDRRLIRGLFPYVRPELRLLTASLTLLAVVAGLSLARPLVMRYAFESGQLTRGGFLLLGVVVLEQGLVFAQMYTMQLVGARAMHQLRAGVFAFLHRQRLAFFDRTPIGRLVTRVTNDTDAVGELFASGALNAVGDLVRLAGIVILMLALDWRMSLFAFALVPPIGLLVEIIRRRARDAFRAIRTKLARLNAFLNEQVEGIEVVQTYGRQSHAAREFDDINRAYRDANFRSISLDALVDASVEMVSSICVASMIWYVGRDYLSHTVSFGTLVAFVAYIEQFFVPIRDLSARTTLLQSGMAGAERITQLFEQGEPDAPRQENPCDAHPHLAFQLEHVSFGYHPSTPVLRDVSLRAQRGQKIALVGPTGAGKSSIASLLLRLYDPQNGTVRVHGRDVRSLSREDLRPLFAVVPQDTFLFRGTLLSNVAAGESVPDRARAEEVLRRVGAGSLMDTRVGGIDAPVEERGSNLSVGQRQLVAFARALYRDAPILLLDEATASVDSDTEACIQQGLQELLRGRTALVIAHRLSTIQAADNIVVLHRGRVVEQGLHSELVAAGGLYARLYQLHMARHDPGTLERQ